VLAVVRHHAGHLEKPTEVVRRYDSRLPWAWDALCIAFPFADKALGGWREVITGAQPTVTGTVTGAVDSRGQIVVRQAGGVADNRLDYTDAPAQKRPVSEVTVFCRFRSDGSGNDGDGVFAKIHTLSTQMSWGVYMWTGPLRVVGSVATTTTPTGQGTGFSGTVPTGAWVNIFFRWRDGIQSTVDVLYDGGAVAAAQGISSTVIDGTLTYGTGPMRIFGTDSNWGAGGDISVLMTYSRRLTDQECVALASDPFGWFAPRREAVTLAAPFPVGPGLAAAGMYYVGPTRG
jgi:hypothetical protein